MRFDDSLATVLSAATASGAGAEAAWRQIVDLIGHGRVPPDPDLLDGLRSLRPRVSVAVRAAASRALIHARPPVALLLLLAEDEGAVRPLLGRVQLRGRDWASLIPRLGPVLRAQLRGRDDLPRMAVRALAIFGSVDLILEGSGAGEDGGDTGPVSDPAVRADRPIPLVPDGGGAELGDPFPIPDLLTRIAEASVDPAATPDRREDVTEFLLETDPEGVVVGVAGAPRGPLIGLSLARAAREGRTGVAASVARAFRERRSIEDGRLIMSGDTAAGGEWHLSGGPRFLEGGSRFLGYRCIAYRPAPAPDATKQTDLLRVLIHELRTPANAITGFAELVESELMGPVPPEQRRRAASIRLRALELLNAIEDLETAARLEAGALGLRPGATGLDALTTRAVTLAAPLARLRRVQVAAGSSTGDQKVRGDERAVERLVARLVTLAVSVGEPDERFVLTAAPLADGSRVRIDLDRPRAWAGSERDAPMAAPAGEGPLLGVGFCLGLLARLASEVGGALILTDDRMGVDLPMTDGVPG